MTRKYIKSGKEFKPFIDGYFNLNPVRGYNYILGYRIEEHRNMSTAILPDVTLTRRINHLPAE